MGSHLSRWVLATAAGLVLSGCGGAPPPVPLGNADDPRLSPDEIRSEYRALAREAFVKGVYLREAEEPTAAAAYFYEALRLFPSDATMRLAFARLQNERGNWAEAKAVLETGIERYGGSAGEYFLVAELRLENGEAEAASAALDSAVALDPMHVEAWLQRGALRYRAHSLPEALRSFEVAQALHPVASTLVHIAECSVALGDSQRAEGALRQALRFDSSLTPARRALAALLRSQDRNEEAIAVFEAGLDDDPDSLDPLLELLFEQDAIERVRDLLAKLEAEGKLSPRHQYLFGRVLVQRGEYDAARDVLQPLARLEGAHGVEELLGEVSMRQEDFEAAYGHFERAIAQSPDDCAAHVGMALVLNELFRDAAGSLTPAHADSLRARLRAASEVTPPDAYRCNLLLGITYAQLHDLDAARQHLESSHQLQPSNTDVLFNLAMVHEELGDFETALRYGRDLLELAPEHAAALNFVGYLLADRGVELADSEVLVRKALAQEPDNGYYVDSLGWVFYKRGEYERAAAELERAVQLTQESDAVILEHLGDVYVKMGRLRGAYRVYKQSRALDPQNTGVQDKILELEAKIQDGP